MAKEKMTPEDKLLKTIWGDKYKTQAEEDCEIEEFAERVKSLSDEEYKKEFGCTREEAEQRTKGMLDDIHWYDCVIKYQLDTKATSGPKYRLYNLAMVAKHFYFAGRRHQSEGLGFDFNGNEVPAEEGWEAKRNEEV